MRITGYTDNVGSLASNRRLSTQRANAVSEYLQQKGISASRIIAKGVPLADYVATNKTEEGRALNRRVEIIIEATGHRAKWSAHIHTLVPIIPQAVPSVK